MGKMLFSSVTLWASLTLVLGVVYPAGMTALGNLLYPKQAQGSLLVIDGQVQASALVGKAFSDPGYFWSRPSATGPEPYNASASSGSNLAIKGKAFQDLVQERITLLKAANPDAPPLVPVDLVTASGSGLDPHISKKAALWQVPRIAQARSLSTERLTALIEELAEGGSRDWYMSPERVNVVLLNTRLDQIIDK